MKKLLVLLLLLVCMTAGAQNINVQPCGASQILGNDYKLLELDYRNVPISSLNASITTWADSSGKGHNATLPCANVSPNLRSDGVEFYVISYASSGSGSSLISNLGQVYPKSGYTVTAIFTPTASNTGNFSNQQILAGDGTTTGTPGTRWGWSICPYFSYWGKTDASVAPAWNPIMASGTEYILTWVKDFQKEYSYRNSVLNSTFADRSYPTSIMNICIGGEYPTSQAGSTYPSNFKLKYFLVESYPRTAIEVQQLYQDLRARFGITW